VPPAQPMLKATTPRRKDEFNTPTTRRAEHAFLPSRLDDIEQRIAERVLDALPISFLLSSCATRGFYDRAEQPARSISAVIRAAQLPGFSPLSGFGLCSASGVRASAEAPAEA